MPDKDAEIAELKARITQLEAKLAPVVPKPEAPSKPPAWAPQTDNCGMNYSGPPTGNVSSAAGIAGIKTRKDGMEFKDPCGLWRYTASGELVTASAALRPIGPQRSAEHEMAVRLLDDGLSRE